MVKKGADLPPFCGVKGADLRKKGADLSTFEQHNKGANLTKKMCKFDKKCADLT